MLIYNLGYK